MSKEFKTYDEQIEILKNRNLSFTNEDAAKQALKEFGYFNIINRYKDPFIDDNSIHEHFNTSFDSIYMLFRVDTALRNLLLPHITDVERRLKASIAHHFSEQYGNDHRKYICATNFKTDSKNNTKYTNKLIQNLNKDIQKFNYKKHKAICHYLRKYGFIPLWVLMSVLTFGRVASFFKSMQFTDQQKVAADLGFSVSELSSIVFFLADIRNICAHSDRLYSFKTDAPQFMPIVNLAEHSQLNIPLDKNGNYAYGRFDVLAVLLILKRCTPPRRYMRLIQSISKVMRLLKISVEPIAYSKIVWQCGLTNQILDNLAKKQ